MFFELEQTVPQPWGWESETEDSGSTCYIWSSEIPSVLYIEERLYSHPEEVTGLVGVEPGNPTVQVRRKTRKTLTAADLRRWDQRLACSLAPSTHHPDSTGQSPRQGKDGTPWVRGQREETLSRGGLASSPAEPQSARRTQCRGRSCLGICAEPKRCVSREQATKESQNGISTRLPMYLQDTCRNISSQYFKKQWRVHVQTSPGSPRTFFTSFPPFLSSSLPRAPLLHLHWWWQYGKNICSRPLLPAPGQRLRSSKGPSI